MSVSIIYTAICCNENCNWVFCDFSVKDESIVVKEAKKHNEEKNHKTIVSKKTLEKEINNWKEIVFVLFEEK